MVSWESLSFFSGKDIIVEYDDSLADLVAAEKDLQSHSTSSDLLPVFVMPEAKRNAKKVRFIRGVETRGCH